MTQEIYEEFESENAVVLAIGAYETVADCAGWKDRFGLTYPVLADPSGTVSRLFWQNAVPHNAVIDDSHILRYTAAGFSENQVRNTLTTYTNPLVKIDFMPLPNTENTASPYLINCQIRCADPLNNSGLKIFWNLNGGMSFNESPLTGSGINYSGTIPAQPVSSTVYYYLHAESTNGKFRNDPNLAPDDLYMFHVIIDTTPPVIDHTPVTRWRHDMWSPLMTASITDELPLDSVTIEYQINGGSTQTASMSEDENGMWNAVFPGSVSLGDVVTYRIKAMDTAVTQHTAYDPASGEFHTMTIIEAITAAVIDLDGNLNSGNIISSAILNLGLTAEYFTSVPDFLELYKSVWVCLGISPDKHVMTSAESEALLVYLEAGGRAYVEGGDAWADDAQMAFLDVFDILGTDSGAGDLSSITGRSDTFCEGFNATYAGDNESIDHLRARGDAYRILESPDPAYGIAVANAVSNFKTIGSSFEFGGITDGAYTKSDLMALYMEFFDLYTIPATPTPTPEPTSTPEPTPTPDTCTTTGVKIDMPSDYFRANDPFYINIDICNATSQTYQAIPLFAILDVGGSMFFWPTFQQEITYQTMDVAPGESEVIILQQFLWPGGVGEASGIHWYAAMTDPAITQLMGEYDMFTFGWGN